MINHHLSLLYEAQLSQLELYFDLDTEEGIKHSKVTLVDFFLELQRILIKPQFFYEVGAFSAKTSLKLKAILPETQCLAFEANIYNYNLFTQENDYENAGVDYRQLAISAKTGREIFHIQKKIANNNVAPIRANNSLLIRQQSGVKYEKLTVDTYSLDDFIQQEQKITLSNQKISLWIDAEGAGFDVLKGSEVTLSQVFSIFMEVEEKQYWKGQILAQPIIKHLLQKGFVPVARDFEAPFQYNIIFLRTGLVSRPAYKHCRSAYYRKIKEYSKII